MTPGTLYILGLAVLGGAIVGWRMAALRGARRGYYWRNENGQVLEARYFRRTDGRWHGALWLDAWQIVEADRDTCAEIDAWCRDAWLGVLQEDEVKA